MGEARFGLFGTGGCARSIMPFVRIALQATLGPAAASIRIVFVDKEAGAPVNGVPVMDEASFLADDSPRYFNVGVANGGLRRKLAERALAAGAQPLSLIAPTAQVFEPGVIGEGAILCPNSVVTVNVRVGRFFHLNLFSYVEHDCVVGDFVTFAPGVNCNGNVLIEDGAFLGSGAVIRQGRPTKPLVIGTDATVGMGAIVTRDVEPNTTVVGNPARTIADKMRL